MEYLLSNGLLSARIDARGGELVSLMDAGGREHITASRKPSIFPFGADREIAEYHSWYSKHDMPVQGLLPDAEFVLLEREADSLTLHLVDSEATRAVFPYSLTFAITYRLLGRELEIAYFLQNDGETPIPFACEHDAPAGQGTGEKPRRESISLSPDATWRCAWRIGTEGA